MNDQHRTRNLSVIGVPFGGGAGMPGTETGPFALRAAGLRARLEQLGFEVRDEGNVFAPPERASSAGSAERPDERVKHLHDVTGVCRKLANAVSIAAAAGRFPLVLGGDHSIAIGTAAGLKRNWKRYGILWFDAHADLNTDETTPTGNIHGMSLAAALGLGHPALVSAAGRMVRPLPANTVIIGARSIDPGERKRLKAMDVTVFTMHEIDRSGIRQTIEQAIAIASRGTEGIHLSFDMDVLDPREAPGVGTPVPGGLSYRECRLAMELLAQSGRLLSAEFVETNALVDSQNRTAYTAVDLIAAMFGETSV